MLLAPAHDLQALRDVGAVQARERHHVGNGRERDKVEQPHEVGLGRALGVVAAPAQLARHRDENEKRHARGAQVPEARHIVLAVRVDERGDRRQPLVGLVVVDDDDVAGKLGGAGERLDARRAAVDGHDEARALLDEAFDGGGVGPVAFEQTVGNVDARLEPVMGKEAGEQRRGRRAVDVVVAEHGHRLARLDRVRDALCRRIHVAQAAMGPASAP